MLAVPGIVACPKALDLGTGLTRFHEMSFRTVFRLVPYYGQSLLTLDAYVPEVEIGANIKEDVVAGLHSVSSFASYTVCRAVDTLLALVHPGRRRRSTSGASCRLRLRAFRPCSPMFDEVSMLADLTRQTLAVIFAVPQTNASELRRRVDGSHDAHLGALFFVIILVDGEYVDP